MNDATQELDQLIGDDTAQTDPAHFVEFANVEQHAAELEGEQVSLNQHSFSTSTGDTPTPMPEIPTADLIAPIVGLVCSVVCPAWEIGAEEQGALSQSYADVLDKYFPEGAGAFGVELSALLVTAAIITPRLKKPRKHKEETAKPTPDTEQEPKEVIDNA